MDYLQHATDLARSHGLATHLDGARLFNAAVATAHQETQKDITNDALDQVNNGHTAINVECILSQARRITSHFDSVSVCTGMI